MDKGDRMYTKEADGLVQKWYVYGWYGPRFAVTVTKNARLSNYKRYYHMNDVGKTIFCTRNEAQKAPIRMVNKEKDEGQQRTCGKSLLSMQDKILIVKQMAERYHISGGELQLGYWYGQNAYADMLIENALFCDMYPDDVPNREDFHGFCRSNYFLSRAE